MEGLGTELGLINGLILIALGFFARWFWGRHQIKIEQHDELWEDYQYKKRREESAKRSQDAWTSSKT